MNQDLDYIFKYELTDAWHMPIYTVSIKNKEYNNVIEIWSRKPASKISSINISVITDINNLIDNTSGLTDIGEVKNFLIDGLNSKYCFNCTKTKHHIQCTNIWNFIGSSNIPDDAKIILNLHESINKKLNPYGINIPYEY